MKKFSPEKYDANKYLRAYLLIISDQLALLTAKVDMLQHGICKDGKSGGLQFLDPKRERLETSLRAKYSGDKDNELAFLIRAIDARTKKDKPSRRS